jgi:uncharacterized protein (TIGR02266 family)
MADPKGDRNASAAPIGPLGGSLSRPYPTGAQAAAPMRDPRISVTAHVNLRYGSILDFHESQSLNISRTGMFIATNTPGPVGSMVEFEFSLVDGLSLLKGKGEVVRVTRTPVTGMGVRFRELDEDSRKCIERIVGINEEEGRASHVSLDFGTPRPVDARPAPSAPVRVAHALQGATRVQPGLSVAGHDLQLRLTPLTVGYFTNNPLINIRLGGFVVPIDEEVSLGASFDVTIVDNDGMSLYGGKGKVVAKDGKRVGVRLSDASKVVLTRLQAEVAKLSPGGR